jgi:twinkle protein
MPEGSISLAGVTLSYDEIDQMIADMEIMSTLEEVRAATAWVNEVLDGPDVVPGFETPWEKITQDFELRPSELSVWSGESGAGKSTMLCQIMNWLLMRNVPVMIASFEMSPVETLRIMVKQAAGNANPSREWKLKWFESVSKNLWIYDKLNSVEADRLIKAIQAVNSKLGVQHVVIDSLTKCKMPVDGNGALTAQTNFVDQLQWIAKHTDLHVHLVTHMRKPERNGRRIEASKYDVRGASQITDLADNVILLTRNVEKEDARFAQERGFELTDQQQMALDKPDAFLRVDKQRATGCQRRYGLWFDQDSRLFKSNESTKPRWEEPWANKGITASF